MPAAVMRQEREMPRGLRVFIFANCQGRGIQHFLNLLLRADTPVEFLHIENYGVLNDAEAVLRHADFIRGAGVFIFQPLSAEAAYKAPALIDELLPAWCQRISFPYIYNNALWPVVIEGNSVTTSDDLIEVVCSGAPLDEVLADYDAGRLQFRFMERFIDTVSILRDREESCDVKVCRFIERQLLHKPLFLTQNHPTSLVFMECARQIHLLLKARGVLPASSVCDLSLFEGLPMNAIGLPGYWPIDGYAEAFYKFRWLGAAEETAAEFYKGLIAAMWQEAGRLRRQGVRVPSMPSV